MWAAKIGAKLEQNLTHKVNLEVLRMPLESNFMLQNSQVRQVIEKNFERYIIQSDLKE